MYLSQHSTVAVLTVCLLWTLVGCSEPAPVADAANGALPSLVAGESALDSATASDTSPADSTNVASDAGSKKSAASSKNSMSAMGGMGKMKFPAPKDMKFKDEIESNVKAPQSTSELVFINKDGNKIKLADYLGKKNVILVFTEGFNGMLCPFCQTQTSRLVANYQRFQERDCEVIVVYPGPKEHLDEFVESALKTEKEQVDQVPFPIVLDQEYAATKFFDIQSKQAHPSTYLIDKKGGVQFAYVGSDMTADRPSVKALIEKLDELN